MDFNPDGMADFLSTEYTDDYDPRYKVRQEIKVERKTANNKQRPKIARKPA